MTDIVEKPGITGEIIAYELKPGTDIIVSEERGENIICKGGADAIATAIGVVGYAMATSYNWMVISTDATAHARASLSIAPLTAVSAYNVLPVVNNTSPTSKVTWTYTFAAGGSASIAKFGMQSTAAGGVLFNEYVFSALKDNNTNDLKVIYTASVAP